MDSECQCNIEISNIQMRRMPQIERKDGSQERCTETAPIQKLWNVYVWNVYN